jgi:beta-carotene 3-hydroxylase
MATFIFTGLIVAAFLFMEFVAWFTHKYVMHGFLWILHKDHHIRDGRKIEWNDAFAVIFATPAIIFIYLGVVNASDTQLALGIGITAYGFSYFMFHDVYVHQRAKIFSKFSNRYLRATIKAHMEHHLPNARYNYGFLMAPMKYYREAFRKQ